MALGLMRSAVQLDVMRIVLPGIRSWQSKCFSESDMLHRSRSSLTPYLWKVDAPAIVAASKFAVTKLVERFPPPGDDLEFADLGCGPGVISIKLALSLPRARIHALDQSLEDFGRFEQPPANVRSLMCDITQELNIGNKVLHGTIFSMVAAGLSDDEVSSVLREIRRTNRSDSLIFIAVPHHQYSAKLAHPNDLGFNATYDRRKFDASFSGFERYLRGEGVLLSLLQKERLETFKVVDVQGVTSSGHPTATPTIRIYWCRTLEEK